MSDPAPTIRRTVRSYRPQHDDDCEKDRCLECHWGRENGHHPECVSKPDIWPSLCTCGLALAILRDEQEVAQEVTPPPSAQEKEDDARSDQPQPDSIAADQRGDLIARFEGRKRVLLLGEHFLAEPPSKDHREDIGRWVYDLDAMIAFLKGETDGRVHNEAGRRLVAVRVHETEGWKADPYQAQRPEGQEVQEVRLHEGTAQPSGAPDVVAMMRPVAPPPSGEIENGVWPNIIAPPKHENPCEGWEDPRLPDFATMRVVAREAGYAIALHGSMKRDADVVAVPWTDAAVGNAELVDRLCVALNAKRVGGPEYKPHGRVAVSLQVDGYVKTIDLSIAAVRSSVQPQGWQPIEMADTTHSRPVLLWCRRWTEPRIGHWFQATKQRGWWVEENTLPCEPSHWAQLLPAPGRGALETTADVQPQSDETKP